MVEEGGGPDMSDPYRDSSESLLLLQAGTAAGGRKRYDCKSVRLYFFIYTVDKSRILKYTGNYC